MVLDAIRIVGYIQRVVTIFVLRHTVQTLHKLNKYL